MDTRTLTPADAPALLPLVEGLAAHHGDTSRASVESLTRDLLTAGSGVSASARRSPATRS